MGGTTDWTTRSCCLDVLTLDVLDIIALLDLPQTHGRLQLAPSSLSTGKFFQHVTRP